MSSQRYLIQLSYRGTNYHGWQVQPNAITVQGTIQAQLAKLFHEEVTIVGSSRTDAGVHAQQQFAHVDLEKDLDVSKLQYQLNAMLPPDIAIASIQPVNPDVHARFTALSRSYTYRIVHRKSPFLTETTHRINGPFNMAKMNEAAAILKRKQDFKSLCKARPTDVHFLCDIIEAYWTTCAHQMSFHIKASRFLRNMVRITVTLLLQVGQERLSIADFEALIDKKERDPNIALAPARGLTLTEVSYPFEINNT